MRYCMRGSFFGDDSEEPMGRKLMVLVVVLAAIAVIFMLDLDRYVSLSFLTSNIDKLRALFDEYPILFGLSFFALYVVCTGLSIPVATGLSLSAGAIFGFSIGMVIVSFAASIGATIAFSIARYALRDYVGAKFASTMMIVDKGIQEEGRLFLFAVRILPLVPFFIVNVVMGLTTMPALSFYWVSQLGMLPATFIYVNAGVHLSRIEHLSEILRLDVIVSLTALGLLPIVSRHLINRLRRRRVYQPYAKQKPRRFDYDLVVIGAGSAGLVTAYIGATLKAKVLLVEKNKMGGDCLNTGCVPSKALIRAAHAVHEAQQSARFGIKRVTIDFDFRDVMERLRSVIKAIEPHDSVERYQSLGVHVKHGDATIMSPWTVAIGDEHVQTRAITIATGAAPLVPPIDGIHAIDYLTSENLWQLDVLPKRLLILGGGPIGCELAQAFARLGARVTIVEMAERILAAEDSEASATIAQRLRDEGIDILTNHKAIQFKRGEHGDMLIANALGNNVEVFFDKVLIAVGRKARTTGFGLEELGIARRPNGTIDVNEYLATKYPNIFACGDAAGPYQFTHFAAHQAWYCAVNGLFGGFKKFAVDYRVIPWCTYTDPEIATVGLTEAAALKANIEYEVVRFPLSDLDRAIIDGANYGFIKVVVAKNTDRIIGATVVSKDASNLIMELVTAMKFNHGLRKILATIHVYPSLGEANKYAAGVWQKAHTPKRALAVLEKYFAWRRH